MQYEIRFFVYFVIFDCQGVSESHKVAWGPNRVQPSKSYFPTPYTFSFGSQSDWCIYDYPGKTVHKYQLHPLCWNHPTTTTLTTKQLQQQEYFSYYWPGFGHISEAQNPKSLSKAKCRSVCLPVNFALIEIRTHLKFDKETSFDTLITETGCW